MKPKEIPANIVVHTPTETEAKELLAILHENGYKWSSDAALTGVSNFHVHRCVFHCCRVLERTCYV
jgi:hypothetical protein